MAQMVRIGFRVRALGVLELSKVACSASSPYPEVLQECSFHPYRRSVKHIPYNFKCF